jgi:hypothetical protein
MGMEWKPYDPTWLVEWVRENVPGEPWLPDALARCTRAAWESRAYVYFVDPANANRPGAEWQIADGLTLEHPQEGTLVVAVLTGRRIGGIEFLRRL